jgi:hypothetical protein
MIKPIACMHAYSDTPTCMQVLRERLYDEESIIKKQAVESLVQLALADGVFDDHTYIHMYTHTYIHTCLLLDGSGESGAARTR